MTAEHSQEIAYDFSTWDAQQFMRAGEVLASIARRREAVENARDAILRLYFMDNPELDK